MQLEKKQLMELADLIATAVVGVLEKRGVKGAAPASRPEKTAYQKTEALLYNYIGFKKIVRERMEEIENLRQYGVPQRSASIMQYSANTGTVGQIVLPEESVEQAIRNVQESVADTVRAIDLVDNGMAALKSDPYYNVLEMLYFEGRTQEDIALRLGCSQVTVSNNKSRLVRELSMRLFPSQVANEMLA